MNIEQAREVASKALQYLSESLEQGQSEVLRTYLAAIGRFHRYSASNLLLIIAQRPNAAHVAACQAWRKLHRRVTQGAKGIVIFAPIVNRTLDTNGCGVETPRENLVSRHATVVFGVADTTGEPLPALSQFEGDPGEYLERLKEFVTESGCSLEYSKSIFPAKAGALRKRSSCCRRYLWPMNFRF
jgi:hypothetical protein